MEQPGDLAPALGQAAQHRPSEGRRRARTHAGNATHYAGYACRACQGSPKGGGKGKRTHAKLGGAGQLEFFRAFENEQSPASRTGEGALGAPSPHALSPTPISGSDEAARGASRRAVLYPSGHGSECRLIFLGKNKMSGAEGALLGSLTASVTGLLALAISRFRIRCVPDEEGNTRCLSACSEHGLVDADELHIEQYTIGDKQVLMLSSKK